MAWHNKDRYTKFATVFAIGGALCCVYEAFTPSVGPRALLSETVGSFGFFLLSILVMTTVVWAILIRTHRKPGDSFQSKALSSSTVGFVIATIVGFLVGLIMLYASATDLFDAARDWRAGTVREPVLITDMYKRSRRRTPDQYVLDVVNADGKRFSVCYNTTDSMLIKGTPAPNLFAVLEYYPYSHVIRELEIK